MDGIPPLPAEVRWVMDMADANRDGHIDVDELCDALEKYESFMARKTGADHISKVIERHDKDKNRILDSEEIKEIMMEVSPYFIKDEDVEYASECYNSLLDSSAFSGAKLECCYVQESNGSPSQDCKVMRGPSWQWGTQDGMKGNEGVIFQDSLTQERDGWVNVKWDDYETEDAYGYKKMNRGLRCNYRVKDSYDLVYIAGKCPCRGGQEQRMKLAIVKAITMWETHKDAEMENEPMCALDVVLNIIPVFMYRLCRLKVTRGLESLLKPVQSLF
eukprot:760093-Hanusia_phi.AAC.2